MIKTRMTHQRRKILEKMLNQPDHISAETLYNTLKDDLPDLSLSTVYRNLKALADAGKISMSDLGNGLVFERVNLVPHHHLVCLSCHSIQTLDHGLVGPLFKAIEANGFEVATTHLCIYGLCSNCQGK